MMLHKTTYALREMLRGIASIAFPKVCVCCGLETTEDDRQLCSFCKEERFIKANPDNRRVSAEVLLPETVCIQHALWQFDKGGVLQDLMHYLKYERLTSIGYELGLHLGQSALEHPLLRSLEGADDAILVPVPLHYLKFRKRGFNQAFVIARGLGYKLSVPVCNIDSVVRHKNTRTQTGFSIEKRIANIQDAFRVRDPESFGNKTAIIVDDVFTTGSTTFELARTLSDAGCSKIVILTVAQA